ncbi:MAG: hypothetical protein KJO09_11800 [Gammaproteobacteria bacterium]|nr:hypothetical protein [Gammaproteobacteria bacterium]
MNVKPRNLMRAMAIAALLGIGIATTISSGGGGGSGSTGTVTPPSDLMVISGANAHDVSAALIAAIDISFDVSEITGGEFTAQSAAGSTRVQKLLWNENLTAKVGATASTTPESCLFGGTVTVTATLADPNALTVGDQITAIFDNCDEGEGYVLDGQMDLMIAAIQGDIMTDVFLLGLDIMMTDMAITEGAETVVVDADITLTLDTLGFPVIVETLAGSELSFTAGLEVLTFTNFEHVFQADIGVVPEAVLVTVNGRLDSAQMGGAIDYATTMAVGAFGDSDPHIGQILISGDDSSVRIVINDSTSVTLEVDTNGDGVIDEYIDTTFAALSGNASSIDSSNALAVAQEVTHASTGFGLMTIMPGTQFSKTEPFGQVQQLGLSTDFGPLELACEDAGTAVVSGFIDTAGTFTTDDSLSAAFSGCGGSELLTGQLDIVVSSFSQDIDESEDFTVPFHFIGTVTATSLESIGENSTWVGSGTLEADYNYVQYFGPLLISGFSASFSVLHGNVINSLSDASATFYTSVEAGTSGSYEGQLTSDRLSGVYGFESISPYDWLPVGSQASPSRGELLVTAGDGGTLRIVVIDQQSIRLDVDYEGDSIVDTTIATTWAELL